MLKLCTHCGKPPTSREEVLSSSYGEESIVIFECRSCQWQGPGKVYFSVYGKTEEEATKAWNFFVGKPYGTKYTPKEEKIRK